MKITNKVLVWIIVKTLRLKPYKVNFQYIREFYDPDVTALGFLNQVKGDFNVQVEEFRQQLDDEIEKASKE